MSSGTQAQIAASQAASAASAEAAKNALDFAKQIFDYQRTQRQPYTNAGAASVQMLMNLLGLTQRLQLGTGGAGTGVRTASLPGTSGATGGSGGAWGKAPSGATLQSTGDVTGRLTSNTGDGGQYWGRFGTDPNQFQIQGGTTPTNLMSATSGSTRTNAPIDPTTAVMVTDPNGSSKWVTAGLAPFYQARGWTVEGVPSQ